VIDAIETGAGALSDVRIHQMLRCATGRTFTANGPACGTYRGFCPRYSRPVSRRTMRSGSNSFSEVRI